MKEIVYNGKSIKLQTYLYNKFGLPFSQFCKYTKENKIKVNNKKAPINYKLENNDIIKLFINDLDSFNNIENKLIEIVYEDNNLIIVNKPSSLPVIDEEDAILDTLINRVLTYLKYDNSMPFKPCLCHRLDTNTSGIVLIAKNKNSQDVLEKIIKDHSLLKEYTAITASIPPQSGSIKSFLLKDAKSSFVKSYSSKIPHSKEALLDYTRIAVNKNFALCKIILKTGRTHQIRVQFASIDAPILGDTKYGNITINSATKIKKQMLVASRIVFPKLDGDLAYLSNNEFKVDTSNIETIFKEL